MLVMLLPTDNPLDDAYEPWRGPDDDTDDADPSVDAKRFGAAGWVERWMFAVAFR